MTQTATLTCPKCRAAMHSYERSGVIIDQCEQCRGLFLDRGELEQLLDTLDAARPDDGSRERPGPQPWNGGHGDRHGKRRRRSSFLEDLLGGD